MDFKLDDSNLRQVIGAAILKELTEDRRTVIMASAIDYLLRPTERQYGRPGPSPLEEAFQAAVRTVAAQIATEMVNENAEIRTKINELVTAAATKVFDENREKTIAKMAEAIERGLSSTDKY